MNANKGSLETSGKRNRGHLGTSAKTTEKRSVDSQLPRIRITLVKLPTMRGEITGITSLGFDSNIFTPVHINPFCVSFRFHGLIQPRPHAYTRYASEPRTELTAKFPISLTGDVTFDYRRGRLGTRLRLISELRREVHRGQTSPAVFRFISRHFIHREVET